MKKITMQDIAHKLSISRVTVWKALNGKGGVSDELRAQILKLASDMGYRRTAEPELPRAPRRTISITVSRPESSIFWMNIIHEIGKECEKNHMNLLYSYIPSTFSPGYSLPPTLTNGTVEGMIIMNVYDATLIRQLNDLNLPKVFLDTVPEIPVDTLKGDLILIEGRRIIRRITERLIERGCRKIGFVGDVQYAYSNRERFQGFEGAMKEAGLPIQEEFMLTKSIGIFSYQEEMNRFVRNLPSLPDAFVCVSDYALSFLVRALHGRTWGIKEKLILTGFDGTREFEEILKNDTTVKVKTNELGQRLLHQLTYRMDHPDVSHEVIHFCPEIQWKGELK